MNATILRQRRNLFNFVVIIAAPFFRPFPLPPPADRRLRAAFLDGAPSLRGRRQEGVGGGARRRCRRPCRYGRMRWRCETKFDPINSYVPSE
jgi:hypothetical protein